MAYIALLEEKLRPALVTPFRLPDSWWKFACNIYNSSDALCPTAAHVLGGCRKLRQSDAALVCFTLAIPSELSGPKSPCQRRPLPHPSNERRGPAAQNHRGRGKGKRLLVTSQTVVSTLFAHHVKFFSTTVSTSHCLPQIYSDAKECLNLLSFRLGMENYFFGSLWVL